MTINPDGRQSEGALSGSREPDPSCTGSGPSGFDPERVAEALIAAPRQLQKERGWSGARSVGMVKLIQERIAAILEHGPDYEPPVLKRDELPMLMHGRADEVAVARRDYAAVPADKTRDILLSA